MENFTLKDLIAIAIIALGVLLSFHYIWTGIVMIVLGVLQFIPDGELKDDVPRVGKK